MPEQQDKRRQPSQPRDLEETASAVGADPEQASREGDPPAGDARTIYADDRQPGEPEPRKRSPR
jgi:hypothetical protein